MTEPRYVRGIDGKRYPNRRAELGPEDSDRLPGIVHYLRHDKGKSIRQIQRSLAEDLNPPIHRSVGWLSTVLRTWTCDGCSGGSNESPEHHKGVDLVSVCPVCKGDGQLMEGLFCDECNGTGRANGQAPPDVDEVSEHHATVGSNGSTSPDDASGSGEDVRYVKLTPASSVKMDRPTWTWDLRIPVGGTTLMAGREGYGKTALACHAAARLTRGQLAGAWHGRPADVIYVGLEDDRETVLVPRLTAAGADLNRFLFVDLPAGMSFSVSADLDQLQQIVEDQHRDVALVILDPLDSHLGPVDSHRKSEVQAAVGKLATLAQSLRCGALGLAHLNKSDVQSLLGKVVGSVGFTTSVRSVLGIGDHPENDDEKVCVVCKANMTGDDSVPAIRFKVEKSFVPHPDGGDPIDTGRAVILGEEDGIDPDSILPGNRASSDGSKLDQATEWLGEMLGDGPMRKRDVLELAEPEGHAQRTLERAVDESGVVVRYEKARGMPAWWGHWDHGDFSPPVPRQDPVARKETGPDQGEQSNDGGFSPSSRNGEKQPEGADDLPANPFERGEELARRAQEATQ